MLERINDELRLANAKKQTLDQLMNAGKISQPTYDNFNENLEETLNDIQTRRENLMRKMTRQTTELEQKIASLETFLVNCEIQHAGGEIDDTLYQNEVNIWTTGLETIKEELNNMKETINTLQTETLNAVILTAIPIEAKEQIEIENPQEKTQEVTIVENVENIPKTETATEEQKLQENIETPQEETAPQEIIVEEQPAEPPVEPVGSFRQEESQAQEKTEETT